MGITINARYDDMICGLNQAEIDETDEAATKELYESKLRAEICDLIGKCEIEINWIENLVPVRFWIDPDDLAVEQAVENAIDHVWDQGEFWIDKDGKQL